jgi:uncharacterized protein (TIGR03067 family)
VAAKPAPSLLESIQGKWKARSNDNDPEMNKSYDSYNYVHTFKGNSWEYSWDGTLMSKGHLSIDETTIPARVDWVCDWSINAKPGAWLGIMDLNGQTLRICNGSVGGKSRPNRIQAYATRRRR